MGDLTKNLSRYEFACSCDYPECKRIPVDGILTQSIQNCIDHFDRMERPNSLNLVRVACHINSGYRCPKHNADIGGSPTSSHMLGMGADIWMEYVYSDESRQRIPDDAVSDYFELSFPGQYGVVRYNTWTHFDVRNEFAYRGDNRA